MNLIAIYFLGDEYLLDPEFADKSEIQEGYQVASETELIAILTQERQHRNATA